MNGTFVDSFNPLAGSSFTVLLRSMELLSSLPGEKYFTYPE
jgi:hypothetical protein